MDRKEIKAEAKAALKGQWFMLFVFLVVVGVISSFTAGILAPILAFGTYLVVHDLLSGKELNANRYGEIFKDLNHLLKLIGVTLLSAIIVAVGFVLFIIPGIIFSMMLCQASFIMMDNPEIGVFDALKRSKAMMKGYKMDLFVFYLSYIGHMLLTIITFGIYSIYFTPLLTVATINYYKHLKVATDNDIIDVEVID